MIKLIFRKSLREIEFSNRREVMLYLKENPMQEDISVEIINQDNKECFNLYSMKSKSFFGKTYKIVKEKKKNV